MHFYVLAMCGVVAAAHTDAHPYPELKTRWQNGSATCDHHHNTYRSALPSHCKVAVAGTGYGGVYFAWRLGVDLGTHAAEEICIFEVNGRVGGRVFTTQDADGAGMPLDVGGYRFKTTDHLPGDLASKALRLGTRCYDSTCASYKILDPHGSSQYALPIEIMLGQLKAKGSQVFFGAEVTDVRKAPCAANPKRVVLTVKRHQADEHAVQADIVMLNIPVNVFKDFPSKSLIGAKGGLKDTVKECVNTYVVGFEGARVFAVYENAWWYNILGKMEGLFGDGTEVIPLSGKYNDANTKCTSGMGWDGRPTYTDGPVPFGNCSGALLTCFDFNLDFWGEYQLNPSTNALSVFTATSKHSDLILKLHSSLMDYHRDELLAHNVDPATLAPPKSILFGSYTTANPYVTAVNNLPPCNTEPNKWKEVRRPNKDYDIFVANQDFSIREYNGWAAGALILAEKVIQSELGLPAPTWLDAEYNTDVIQSLL